MTAAHTGNTRLKPRHALAGLQAGILGALLMIGWLMLPSLWNRRSVWMVPNLFGTTFYGAGVYRNQFTQGTWAGLAVLLSIYGLGGIVWGLLWRDDRRPLMLFYGAITGLLVYYALFHVIWKAVNPLVPLYAPDRQLEFAHLLWGMALARSPRYSRRIAAAMAAGGQDAADVRSGEVIR